jgi:hypothetical protein
LANIPIWWVMSAVFHTLVLGWLALFSPVRIINLEERPADFTAGTDKIREVMDQVREYQANVLAPEVRSLQDILMELAELERIKQGEYEKFAGEFAEGAPDLAAQSQADALQAQTEAQASQAATTAPLEQLRRNPDSNAWQAVVAAFKKTEDHQDRAAKAMDRALQTLTLSDSSLAPARQAQAEANALQRRASQEQLAAGALREDAQWAADTVRSRKRDVDRHTESIQRAEGDVAKARTNLMQAQMDTSQARTEAQTAQTEADQAKTTADQTREAAANTKAEYDKLDAKDPARKTAKTTVTTAQNEAGDAKRKAESAQRKADQARSKTESAAKKVTRVETDVTNALTRLTNALVRATQLQTEVSNAVTKAEAMVETMAKRQAEALKSQAEARLAQAKAQQALTQARQQAATNELTNPFTRLTNALPELPDVYRQDLATLYQTAVTTETQLTEAYKRIRATELAMIRQIPLPRALELTEVAKVMRPDLKETLKKVANSGEDVPVVREAVQAAGSEINAMLTLGTSLLAQAKGLSGSGSAGGAPISLDWVRAQTAQMQAMEGLAAEDGNARAKDMAASMKGGAKPPGAGGGGGGREGMNFGSGGPPPMPKTLAALAGRKVKSGATAADWMYVDSWHIIGPFDNAGRENIEKKFPPETVVDLNATYLGKDNQPIRWEFTQVGEPRVTPTFRNFHPERHRTGATYDYWIHGIEYIIYYAYTELYFEQACDLWIAVGSDDYCKVWIEDQLVWASGKQQKTWRLDEGLRKVHFHQGVNRVLFRVENGWRGTDFSLVLSLK